MAIFHLTLKTVSRSKGQSVVAAAAYRAGERFKDQETGEVKDFAHKRGVAYREIQLPPNAPERYQDRATLWNAVQAQETRRNAQLAREVEVALPQELARETQIRLVQDYVDRNFVQAGMCADWALHDKGDGNPHAHILLTTRSLKANGDWAPKQKSTYLQDPSGAKIPQIDAKTGQQKIGAQGRKMWQRTTVAYNDWNERDNAEKWRADWAVSCNRYLTADQQIDHRSYDRQGSEQLPTIHEGHTARQMGDRSERVQLNQQIKAANHQLAELRKQVQQLRVAIEQLLQRLKAVFAERYGNLSQESRSKPVSEDAVRQPQTEQLNVPLETATEKLWPTLADFEQFVSDNQFLIGRLSLAEIKALEGRVPVAERIKVLPRENRLVQPMLVYQALNQIRVDEHFKRPTIQAPEKVRLLAMTAGEAVARSRMRPTATPRTFKLTPRQAAIVDWPALSAQQQRQLFQGVEQYAQKRVQQIQQAIAQQPQITTQRFRSRGPERGR
ncbi:MobQ family relaxase [Secundilactobacillus kimchicus]|nr:MobQ family relaxase [Secundilactobacillus kimchicus]